MSAEPVPKSIAEFDIRERLRERIPAIEQALEIARLMPESDERTNLLNAVASIWKVAHCTLFVVAEDHSGARNRKITGIG